MKKLFWFIATFLLALTSCTNEALVEESVPVGKIQASFEESSSASRLAVGEGNALTWSAYDTFVMFNESEEQSYWKMTGTPGEPVGTFEGKELAGRLRGAAFPSSVSPGLDGDVLTMVLPTEITYQKGICNLPMWASFSSLEENVSFKHLGALLKIDFSDIPEGYNSLIVTADKPIAGAFTVDLSAEQPVLQAMAKGVNRVKVSFDAIKGSDDDRLFYIPLPVGTYESINVSISNGSNQVSIADWSNRAIARKKVYLASLTYRVSDAKTLEEVTEELKEMVGVASNATVEIVNKINAAEGSIEIPASASKVGLDFAEAPVTTSSAPLTIKEAAASEGTKLTVSLPTSADNAYVKFDTPTTTVNVEGGNYKQIIASTAANTLVLGENTIVEDLVIVAGNVVLEGGKVTGSITRDNANMDEVTYVYVESKKELEGVTIGDGIKVLDNPKADYVTFSAEAEQTLTMSAAVETLEYSVNGGRWTELGTTTVTFGGDKGNLHLRGKSAIGTSTLNASSYFILGNNELPTACTGNILTLVDYENYESGTLDTSNTRFRNLFFGCNSLTSAPQLPATVLADNCYYQMFVYCYNLKEIPELPATTLAKNCYQSMFYECTSLKEVEELPATVLADSCYYQMFIGCTNLEIVPESLPATTLAEASYARMFKKCTSLTKAPQLPATTLADYCYHEMFSECMGLTQAPELPATKLAYGCYHSMFFGCGSLSAAPALPATTLATDCYLQMFMDCKSLTQAPELPATTLASRCYMNMFWGTGLTQAPELPATTLASECYMQMFVDCVKLSAAPELPVTTLASACYQSMFSDCTGLTEAPELPATKLAANCYSSMFNRCAGLTEAPALPATELAAGCYSGMFSNCTSLTEAPELPATKLANGCYNSMFNRCTNLTQAPELPATTMEWGCYRMMFMYCTSLVTAPELPATTLAERSYQMMFMGCSNLKNVTMMATDVTANLGLDSWLDGVAANGTFYKNSSVSDVSNYGIPAGWTVMNYGEEPESETYQIRYTSTDGNIVNPNSGATFGANIVSNTYENGMGVIEFDGPVTAISASAFSECKTLKSIEIPNTVTDLGSWSFFYCDALKSVKLSDNIIEIKPHTFNRCEALESVVIPDKVTVIGERAFGTNLKMKSVTLPKNLTTIGTQAFCWNEALESIIIPEKVTSLGMGAFTGCKVLNSFYCKATTPPVVNSFSLPQNGSAGNIYVPASSLEAYITAWKGMTSCNIVASTEY